MHRFARIASTAIALIVFGFQHAISFAAEGTSRFDLPAEALDKALRDFAIQAHCNISYEPSAVAGLRAPAIKGDFTPDSALSLLLNGTRLRAVSVNEDTIQIIEKSVTKSQNNSLGTQGDYSRGAEVMRIAYADPSAPSDPPVADDSAPARAPVKKPPARDQDDLEEITVTGSHIRGVSSASPVIEIGREEIERSGFTSISDLMLSLPQNFGGGYNPGTTVGNSQINNRYSDNPTGASVPNLRGLGPGSTLTLINGHRMASGLTGGGADISSIPLEAIERIEIVTDGASSIYGSDAVAGVVNIILKKDFDGATTGVSYGTATQGGGAERRVSQTLGTTWNSGNVVFAYEHRQQDLVDAGDRAFTSAALEPFSLLPRTRSDSLTVSATQNVSTGASLFIDGLYVARDANSYVANAGLMAPFDNPSTLRKYAVTTGINLGLGENWKLTGFANAAEDATENDTSYLTVPSLTPGGAERLLGTLRNVEINANGDLARLPSGMIRLAVGAGYRTESFSDLFGTTGGAFYERDQGDRAVRYGFGELSIPLVEHTQRPGLNMFDVVVSARDEHYSDFGSKLVPKLGLIYSPANSTKFRATWGQAFKAPNLDDLYAVQQLVILDLPDPTASAGASPVFVKSGGNPALRPESADTFSAGVDYISPVVTGLQVSTTFFDIKYTERISQIANPFSALTDPLSAFFLTRSASPAALQSLYNSYPPSEIFNSTGAPLNLQSAADILEYRLTNVSRQTALGADLNINYRIGAEANGTTIFFNATYLDLTQQDTPQASSETLSGLAFYPAKLRSRAGANWKRSAWAFTGTLNYLGHETNTQVIPIQPVGSWTTVDASLRYAPVLPGLLSGLHVSLAAINVFDRNPPRVLIPMLVGAPNFDYDSSNASPLGRFVSLTILKQW